jgi:DNA-binding winged helix-turn-helix (wHTH) protein/TolB-like protein
MSARAYQFGAWLVEPERNRVSSDADERHLEPLSMTVLAYLLEHSGEVVSAERLLEVGWSGRVVESNAVPRVINEIRRALDDDSKHPRYIETIRKRGYRAAAPVIEDAGGEPSARRGRVGPQNWRPALILAGAVLAVAAIGWWLSGSRSLPPAEAAPSAGVARIDPRSVAVLPVVNLSSDESIDFIAAVLTEDVANTLSVKRSPSVAALRTSAVLAESANDVTEIGQALRVGYVVAGSVRPAGQDLVLSVRLVRAEDARLVWSKSYTRDRAAFVADSTTTVFEITNNLYFRTLRDADARAMRQEPFHPDAIEQFLTGWDLYREFAAGNGGSWKLITDHYRKATEIDPDYPEPYHFLANAYRRRAGLDIPVDEARRLAYQALDTYFGLPAVDNPTPGLLQLGEVALQLDLDYQAALTALEACLERQPDHGWCHLHIGRIRAAMGDVVGARRALAAAEQLDYYAETGVFWQVVGQLRFALGDLAEAGDAWRLALMSFDNPLLQARILRNLAWLELELGGRERTVELVTRAWELAGQAEPHTFIYLYAMLGDDARVVDLLDGWDQQWWESQMTHTYNFLREDALYNYLALGMHDQAAAVLLHVVDSTDERLVPLIRVAWYLDPLRETTEFGQVIRKMESIESRAGQVASASETDA